MEEYYSKTELSKVFGEFLKEDPSNRDYLMSIWTKIKALRSVKKSEYEEIIQSCKNSPERAKSFVYDLSMYIQTLIRDDEIQNTDVYWTEVAKWMNHFAMKYGIGTLEYQWGIALFFAADDIVTGKRKIVGEDHGVLNRK